VLGTAICASGMTSPPAGGGGGGAGCASGASGSASSGGGAGGGGSTSAGLSKSYQARREALFTPRDFLVMGNYQAIVQLFDGKSVADAVRCYLFPDYLVKKLNGRIPWWRAKEQGHP